MNYRDMFYKLLFLLPFVLIVSCENQGKPMQTFIVDDQGTYGAAISKDGKYLFTGAIEGIGRVWDIKNEEVLYNVQHQDNLDGGMIAAEFSDNGSVLVTMGQQSMARWNVSDGRLRGYWSWPDNRDLAISADGSYALIGMKSNQAVYFDMVNGKMVFVFPHHEKINSVALSKNGRFALTGSDDWHASLWDLHNKGKHIWSKNMNYKISNVSLSDDGEFAFVNAYVGKSRIFSTQKEGNLISEFPEKRMTVASADFSDDNAIIATGRASRGIDLWNVNTGEQIDHWAPKIKHLVQPDASTILDIKLSQYSKKLTTHSSTGILQTWDINQ